MKIIKNLKLALQWLKDNFFLISGLILIGLMISIPLIYKFRIIEWLFNSETEKINIGFLSALGDAFGGLFGVLLTFVSILFLLDTLQNQRKELRSQRKEFFENKIYTIVYKEHEMWLAKMKDEHPMLLEYLHPFLSNERTLYPYRLHSNFSKISQLELKSILEFFNHICFRLFMLVFDNKTGKKRSEITLNDQEVKDFLFLVGSLFEITKMYAYWYVIFCFKFLESKHIQKSGFETELCDILFKKTSYIRILAYKIYEYQINDLSKDPSKMLNQLSEFSFKRLVSFYFVSNHENGQKTKQPFENLNDDFLLDD